MVVRDYSAADALLHHARTKRPVPTRRVANNTYLERRPNGTIAVRLHNTDVVVYHEKFVEVFTGGWYTPTTKDRIETFAPCRIDIVQGMWTIGGYVPFFEGARIEAWNLVGNSNREIWQTFYQHNSHNKQIRKMVASYVTGFNNKMLITLMWQAPTSLWSRTSANTYTPPAGTCSLCMPTQDFLMSIGEAMEDKQHLIDHMLEGVYSGHMLNFAMVRSHCTTKNFLHATTSERRSALRKYLLAQLLMGPTMRQTSHTYPVRKAG